MTSNDLKDAYLTSEYIKIHIFQPLEEPEPELIIDKGTEIEPRSTLLDKNRAGVKVEAAPYGLPFAAVSDSLGRVSIVETNSMKIIRIIKGVRDCQISWLRSSDGARNALFLVTLDRLGVLAVFSVHFGPRVATWNVGKGAKLVSHSHQVIFFEIMEEKICFQIFKNRPKIVQVLLNF